MKAFNLVKADMRRVARDMPLKIILLLTVVVNLFTIGSYKLLEILSETLRADGMDEMIGMMGQSMRGVAFFSCLSLSNTGVLVCVAVAMFIGKDFSYNTLRAKIYSGNSRLKIYLSTLTTALIIGLTLHVASVLESAAITAACFGGGALTMKALQASLLSIPLYAGFIAVMVFISLTLKSQVLGLVVNIVVAAFIPTILQIVGMAGLESLDAVVTIIPYAAIGKLSTGVVDGALAVKSCVGGLALAVAATAVGALLFRNADIK